MPCDVELQIRTDFNSETQDWNTFNTVVAQVNEEDHIDVNQVMQFISGLSEEEQNSLRDAMALSKRQVLTQEMVENHNLIGNTTINDLLDKYPKLRGLYKVEGVTTQYNIITGTTFKVNNINYNGRVVTAEGNELFIIKDEYAATQFLKYIQARQAIENADLANDINSNLLLKLQAVQKHYKDATMYDTLMRFLNERNTLEPFESEGDTIDPKYVLYSAINTLTANYTAGEEANYTEFEAAVDSLRPANNRKSYEWVIPKTGLYDLLASSMEGFADQISQEQFNELSTDEMQELLLGPKGLFRGNPKFDGATIKKVGRTITTVAVNESTKAQGILDEDQIQLVWSQVYQNDEETANYPNYKDYQRQHIKSPRAFVNKFNSLNAHFATTEGSYPVKCEISYRRKKNDTVKYKFTYNYDSNPKIIERASNIVLEFPEASIGETYTFGYDTQPIFSPVSNGFAIKGRYKGKYISKALVNDKPLYAVSRGPITTSSYAKVYATEKQAQKAIDLMEEKDTITNSGLYSLNKQRGQQGRVRQVPLEQREVKEGQLITAIDYPITTETDIKEMPYLFKELFKMSVPEFRAIAARSPISDINDILNLNTPDKIAAFLFAVYPGFSSQSYFEVFNTHNTDMEYLFKCFNDPAKSSTVKQIINDIQGAKERTYLVEKLETDIEGNRIATITDVTDDINRISNDEDLYLSTSTDVLTRKAIEQTAQALQEEYGVQVIPLSNTELIQFSMDENLGIEDKVEGIKAFVHKGNIYINTSTASVSDLYHEMAHMFLGVIKAQSPEAYLEVMQQYQKHPRFNKQLGTTSRLYENMAQQDQIEEVVAELIAFDISCNNVENPLQGSQKFNIEAFEQVIGLVKSKIETFKSTISEGTLFKDLFKDLMSSNITKMERNRRISNFIEDCISKKQIIENC